MKTNGQYFAKRMFDTLVEEGLSSIKAAYVRDRIVETAEAKGWPDVSHNARAKLSRFSADMQSAFVDDDGVAILHTGVPKAHQPLVVIADFGRPKAPQQITRTIIRRAA